MYNPFDLEVPPPLVRPIGKLQFWCSLAALLTWIMSNRDIGFFFVLFGAIGLWIIVRPAGVIALARHAYPNLREHDPKTTSVMRFIGAWFICIAVLFLVAFVMSRT